MRNFRSSLVSAAAMAALFSSAAYAQSGATPPALNITSPTGTVYSAVFPYTQPVATQITMTTGVLGNLTGFNVAIDGNSITGNLNAYTQSGSACTTDVTTNGKSCTSDGSTVGTITVPWTVSANGTYTITVVAKYKNAEGQDSEQVTVANSTAEYPAPPAVANAYINASTWRTYLTGKQRGCVISKIAEQHGKFSAYGPKGGPYSASAIEQAVGSFAGFCPA